MADAQTSRGLPGLPYDLPKDLDGRVVYLAKLLDLDIGPLKRLTTEHAAQVLTEVVLYHHLDRFEQRRIMKHIRSLPGPLAMKLEPKITDPIWNPSLGLWALPAPELNQRLKRLEKLDEIASGLGLGASATGVRQLVQNASRGSYYTVLVTVLIWGIVGINKRDLDKTAAEAERRTPEMREVHQRRRHE